MKNYVSIVVSIFLAAGSAHPMPSCSESLSPVNPSSLYESQTLSHPAVAFTFRVAVHITLWRLLRSWSPEYADLAASPFLMGAPRETATNESDVGRLTRRIVRLLVLEQVQRGVSSPAELAKLPQALGVVSKPTIMNITAHNVFFSQTVQRRLLACYEQFPFPENLPLILLSVAPDVVAALTHATEDRHHLRAFAHQILSNSQEVRGGQLAEVRARLARFELAVTQTALNRAQIAAHLRDHLDTYGLHETIQQTGVSQSVLIRIKRKQKGDNRTFIKVVLGLEKAAEFPKKSMEPRDVATSVLRTLLKEAITIGVAHSAQFRGSDGVHKKSASRKRREKVGHRATLSDYLSDRRGAAPVHQQQYWNVYRKLVFPNSIPYRVLGKGYATSERAFLEAAQRRANLKEFLIGFFEQTRSFSQDELKRYSSLETIHRLEWVDQLTLDWSMAQAQIREAQARHFTLEKMDENAHVTMFANREILIKKLVDPYVILRVWLGNQRLLEQLSPGGVIVLINEVLRAVISEGVDVGLITHTEMAKRAKIARGLFSKWLNGDSTIRKPQSLIRIWKAYPKVIDPLFTDATIGVYFDEAYMGLVRLRWDKVMTQVDALMRRYESHDTFKADDALIQQDVRVAFSWASWLRIQQKGLRHLLRDWASYPDKRTALAGPNRQRILRFVDGHDTLMNWADFRTLAQQCEAIFIAQYPAGNLRISRTAA